MVFLIAYALFEVPSNYFLKKLRPSVRFSLQKLNIKEIILNIDSDGSPSSCYHGVQSQWASVALIPMPK